MFIKTKEHSEVDEKSYIKVIRKMQLRRTNDVTTYYEFDGVEDLDEIIKVIYEARIPCSLLSSIELVYCQHNDNVHKVMSTIDYNCIDGKATLSNFLEAIKAMGE